MRNYLIFNGNDSRNYGVYLTGTGTYSAPERAQEMISVPGRNGNLIGTETRFENIEVTYPAFIYSNFNQNIQNFRNMLLANRGYFELSDSYHTDEYRMATYIGAFEPEVTAMHDAGSFELVFNCKPQRFLNSGKTTTQYTTNSTINNPTLFPSNPLIRVVGEGTFYIGTTAITITSPGTAYVDIDSDMQDCFYGTQNLNDKVAFSGYKFPVLNPGNNGITFGTGISSITITPRWWRI